MPHPQVPFYGRLWASAKVAAPVLLGLILTAPSPLSAAERVCNGTLLQIQVNERGTTRSDRFRFLLRLEAENASKDIAMTTLNARLAKARQAIQPLVLGRHGVHPPKGSQNQHPQQLASQPACKNQCHRSRA